MGKRSAVFVVNWTEGTQRFLEDLVLLHILEWTLL